MERLIPPSLDDLKRNLRLLAQTWAAGGWSLRYFIVSLLVSGFLTFACSAGSLVAGVAGMRDLYLGLLMAAALCIAHALVTWNVLKRRYAVRFEAF